MASLATLVHPVHVHLVALLFQTLCGVVVSDSVVLLFQTLCGVAVSDSNNTVDLQYTTLSQSLVMHTVGTHSQPVIRGQHQYFLVFTGCKLSEAVLKDWLRACAKQVRQTAPSPASVSFMLIEHYRHPCRLYL